MLLPGNDKVCAASATQVNVAPVNLEAANLFTTTQPPLLNGLGHTDFAKTLLFFFCILNILVS